MWSGFYKGVISYYQGMSVDSYQWRTIDLVGLVSSPKLWVSIINLRQKRGLFIYFLTWPDSQDQDQYSLDTRVGVFAFRSSLDNNLTNVIRNTGHDWCTSVGRGYVFCRRKSLVMRIPCVEVYHNVYSIQRKVITYLSFFLFFIWLLEKKKRRKSTNTILV